MALIQLVLSIIILSIIYFNQNTCNYISFSTRFFNGKLQGKAKYYKLNKTENKNIAMMYVKAMLIPIIIHTIYDATNVKNAGLESGVPENVQEIAVLIALVTMLLAFILQIIAHIKIKKRYRETY